MGITYDHIPEHIIEWIPKQHMFWVATAPRALDGHINISPKGVAGTFHVTGPSQVWYEDLSGTGAETIAHIRENGRITILFNAFEGPPRIARLYGKGSYHEFGSAEYNRLLPLGMRQPGSRAVIVVDVWKVAATCGYSVPYFTFNGHRVRLLDWAAKREKIDQEESQITGSDATHHPKGMATWWRDRNMFSLDGLPALSTAFSSTLGIGSHQPVPKTGAPRVQSRQQISSSTGFSSSSTTTSILLHSIANILASLWACFAAALTAMILSSPIIGYPPLSIQSADESHACSHSGHKMGYGKHLSPQTRPILGYAFSFLLGVALTISFGAMSKPIAVPG